MTTTDRLTVLRGGPTGEERHDRLTAGADDLADRRGAAALLGHPRLLLAVASALMTFGLTLILLGWLGAARSTFVEEQVPYLISGGLLGLALALIGALTFFAHWLTVMAREARVHDASRRQDHAALMEALAELTAALTPEPDGRRPARSRAARGDRPLRGTSRSS